MNKNGTMEVVKREEKKVVGTITKGTKRAVGVEFLSDILLIY